MFLRPMRTYAAAGLGTAVLAAGLTLVAPTAHAVTTPDSAAASWLTAQIGADHLVQGSVARTIDFALALDEIGGSQTVLDQLKQGVDANVATYATDGVTDAQAAVYYQAMGVDARTVDGDLIAKVEALTNDSTGEMTESFGGAWSQWLAVRALTTAGSSEAPKALTYLLGLQSPDGGWPGFSGSDADDTADALFGLLPLKGSSTAVDNAIASGVAYLESTQKTDGGFDNFGENASSTGLSAHALMLAGETGPAARAARWLRQRQVAGTLCDGKLAADGGAVAYSDTVFAQGITDGIAADSNAGYDWYGATIQSLVPLAAAPAATGALGVSAPAWVRAGSTDSATAVGLALGQRGCLSLAGKNVAVVGGATRTGSFAFPAGSHAYQAVLRVEGSAASRRIVALAPKVLTVGRSRAVVAKGGVERITVAGLHSGEPVSISYNGTVVAKGVATSTGRFVRSIAVGRRAGTKTVYAVGRFGTRKGHASFTVR
ncbi:MAG TPA: prenyltransferase/squalene oxidase repeat-containing protein [Nocardioides sp.]|nr:prenyltransferase/squalene oxidase repeat-containing protein [Nocardioides sp.]